MAAGISAALSSGVTLAPSGACVGAIPTVRVSFKDVVPAYWGGARRTAAADRADRGGLAHESSLRWSRSAVSSVGKTLSEGPTIKTNFTNFTNFSHPSASLSLHHAVRVVRASFAAHAVAPPRATPPLPVQLLGGGGPRGVLHRGWAPGAAAASTLAKGLFISPLDAIAEYLAETNRWSGTSVALSDSLTLAAVARADGERGAAREAARFAFRAALPPRGPGDEAVQEEMVFTEAEVFQRARAFEVGFLQAPPWDSFAAAAADDAAIFTALAAALGVATVGSGAGAGAGPGLEAGEASAVLRAAQGGDSNLNSGRTLSSTAGLGPRATAVRLAALVDAGVAVKVKSSSYRLVKALEGGGGGGDKAAGAGDPVLMARYARMLCAEASNSHASLSAMRPPRMSKPWRLGLQGGGLMGA